MIYATKQRALEVIEELKAGEFRFDGFRYFVREVQGGFEVHIRTH